MKLHNKETGQCLAFKSYKSTINYCICENDLINESEEHSLNEEIDETYKDSINRSIFEMKEYLCLKKIQEQEEYNSWMLVENGIQNWVVDKSFEFPTEDMKVRVLVPHVIERKARENRDNLTSRYYPLYKVIQYAETLNSKSTIIGELTNVQYLEHLEDLDKRILELYINEGVIIDYRQYGSN